MRKRYAGGSGESERRKERGMGSVFVPAAGFIHIFHPVSWEPERNTGQETDKEGI